MESKINFKINLKNIIIFKNKFMVSLSRRSIVILQGKNSFFNLSLSIIVVAIFAVIVRVLGFGGNNNVFNSINKLDKKYY